MRFMVMHKVDANMEAGGPPAKSIIEGMGKLVGAGIQSGVFKDGAGLHRSAARARLVTDGGKRTVTRGPYTGKNELLASFAMITAPSLEHAIEVAARLAEAIGDVEIEIGPVVEPWDLGIAEKPEGVPPRFLLLRKADRASERGAATPPALAKVLDALSAEGTLLSTATLLPSNRGVRLDHKRHWTDGPFAESKELVAGFSVIELPSLADAKKWAEEYGAILGENQIDVREVA
jgi:hypothetical protein